MLDVIRYGSDKQGHLTLRERNFAGLGELSSYSSSPKAESWGRAEIEGPSGLGRSRMVRCEPDAIRSKVKPALRVKCLN